jgi:hypothetical protein
MATEDHDFEESIILISREGNSDGNKESTGLSEIIYRSYLMF